MVNARNDRNICLNSHLLRGDLITHALHQIAGRSDKFDAGCLTGTYKVRILRKESVTGMDRIAIRLLRDLNDTLDIQICINRAFLRVEHIGLICFCSEHSVFILFGINTYCGNTKLCQRTVYSNSDLAAVRNQNTPKLPDLDLTHSCYLLPYIHLVLIESNKDSIVSHISIILYLHGFVHCVRLKKRNSPYGL